MHWRMLSMIACVPMIAACSTPFVNSGVGAGQALSDPKVVGDWKPADADDEDSAVLHIEAAPGARDVYRVVLTECVGDKTRTLELEARLTELGGRKFADLFLAKSVREDLVGVYGGLAVPVHQMLKYTCDGDELKLWQLDSKQFEKLAAEAELTSTRVVIGGGSATGDGTLSMIVAPTEQIRKFLAAHADDEDIFDALDAYRRVK